MIIRIVHGFMDPVMSDDVFRIRTQEKKYHHHQSCLGKIGVKFIFSLKKNLGNMFQDTLFQAFSKIIFWGTIGGNWNQ